MFLKKLYCWLRRKHRWDKWGALIHEGDFTHVPAFAKKCRICGEQAIHKNPHYGNPDLTLTLDLLKRLLWMQELK